MIYSLFSNNYLELKVQKTVLDYKSIFFHSIYFCRSIFSTVLVIDTFYAKYWTKCEKKVTIYYLNIQILTEIPLQYIYNQTHCFVDIKLYGVSNFKPFCLAGTSLAGTSLA